MMQVSTASVDITPAIGYPMAGYGTADGPRLSEGVNEPLRARCTVYWDDDVPKVIVTADVLGFCHPMHRQIRQGVLQLGVVSADFALHATHTHNGPVLIEKLDPYIAYGMDDIATIAAYSQALCTQLISLVNSALLAPRTACTLDYYVLDENFSYNREALPYVERDVPTLVARSLDGAPRAVLFGYGTHPVAAARSTLFDPDYPSEAIKTIESEFEGCFAQFLLGAAGDQNPLSTEAGFSTSDAYGHDLGLTIANEIGSPGRALAPPVATAYAEVPLPLDVTDTPLNRASLMAVFAARAADLGLTPFHRRHGEVMQTVVADSDPLAATLLVPIQRWRFAGQPGLTMVMCGGEIVSGYAVYFRAHHGGSDQLWFSGYANEVTTYIPSDEMLTRPSYGAGFDSDYPGVAGGSMTVYGHLGHFRGQTAAGDPGVEQVLIDRIGALL